MGRWVGKILLEGIVDFVVMSWIWRREEEDADVQREHVEQQRAHHDDPQDYVAALAAASSSALAGTRLHAALNIAERVLALRLLLAEEREKRHGAVIGVLPDWAAGLRSAVHNLESSQPSVPVFFCYFLKNVSDSVITSAMVD